MDSAQALAIAAAAFVTSLAIDGGPYPRLPGARIEAAYELAQLRAEAAALASLGRASFFPHAIDIKTCEPAHSYGRL